MEHEAGTTLTFDCAEVLSFEIVRPRAHVLCGFKNSGAWLVAFALERDELFQPSCCLSRQLAGDAFPDRCSVCSVLVCLDCVEEHGGACPGCGAAIPLPGG